MTTSTRYGKPVVPWERDDGGYDVQPLHHGNEIYYRLNLKSSNHFYQIWKYAINTWNNLGVIKLTPAPTHYSGAVINLSGARQYDNQISSNRISIAQTKVHAVYSPKYQHSLFTRCNIKLSNYLNQVNLGVQKQSATHELGHALGFDHDSTQIGNRVSVMNAVYRDNYVIPGDYDKAALMAVYQPHKFKPNQLTQATHQYVLPVMTSRGRVVSFEQAYGSSATRQAQVLQSRYNSSSVSSQSNTDEVSNNNQDNNHLNPTAVNAVNQAVKKWLTNY